MELKNFNKDKVRRKPLLETGNMVFGKIPPQAKDLEEAILGAIMLEKSAFDTVIEILKPECFYVEAHQKIYKAMQSLQIKNLPIDLLWVFFMKYFYENPERLPTPRLGLRRVDNVQCLRVQQHRHWKLIGNSARANVCQKLDRPGH